MNRNEIDNAVSSIDDFPSRAEAPVIERLNTQDPVLEILVSGPLDAVGLKAYCEGLKDRLLRSGDISDVKIHGFSDHLLRVDLGLVERETTDAAALRAIAVADIVDADKNDHVRDISPYIF